MAGTLLLAQQHSYTQADIDAGSRIYESSCGGCHGENGDRVPGVDFSKGLFKTARSDEDLVRIIRNGVANTAMPSNPFSEAQADTVVAFVRSLVGGAARPAAAAPIPGDAVRGKAVFEGKGNCLSCHPVAGVGGGTGPDLGPAGARGGGNRGGGPGGGGRGGTGPNPQQIQRSILDPNAEIAQANRVYQVATKNGTTVRGTLLNQDTFSVQLRDSNGRLAAYLKTDLREYGFLPSPMPSYKDKLTAQEVADVVSYLISLRSN